MASRPRTEIIRRTHVRTRPPGDPGLPAATWAEIERTLLGGAGTTWLSVGTQPGVHVRPVMAAWTGASFVFASKGSAVKSRHLDEQGRCSLAVDLGDAHLVVEGTAARLTGPANLARASTALLGVFDWPTTVVGDELDAPYAAPTSGGPPFRAYEITPERALVFPVEDQFDPTRFTFG